MTTTHSSPSRQPASNPPPDTPAATTAHSTHPHKDTATAAQTGKTTNETTRLERELVPVQIRCSEVRFVKELYPRLKPHDDVVERYRDALDQLPPIVVARDGILVDGYHRWQAHVREGRHEINAENLGNLSDAEIVRESIKRNASHGQQLDRKDKQRMAGQLWQTLAHLESTERMKDIAELLAVSERSVQSWTKDARKTERDQLRADVIDAWLNCVGSNRELADAFAVDDKTVGNWTAEFAQSCGDSAPESRQHFDIWQFATADKNDGQQSYFGAVPPQVMENLLWFYTDPGQIVVDLFAGSGTTVDVAKKMGRRVWASDIRGNHYSPHLPIHQHDAGTGWPEMAFKLFPCTVTRSFDSVFGEKLTDVDEGGCY